MDLSAVQIRVLTMEEPAKLIELVSFFGEVFGMEVEVPNSSAAFDLLSRDDFFAIVAELDGVIVGGMAFYLLKRVYNSRPWGYVMDLAVAEKLQRRGIGKKLMGFVKSFAAELGADEVFVQAETADDYAVDFYRKTHPTGEMDVNHFFYKLD